MKYCPYCGADLADGVASFCMECGKSLPTAEGGQKKPKEKPVRSQKRMEKKIIGRCPLCGGNVVKTCKGYRCENNIAEQPTCVLNINGIIGNRKMSDEEITELLEHRFILLDGFASKEGKTFPSVLELAQDGAINMQSVIGKCPHCGGDIRVGTRAFNCSNYSNQQAPCNFAIWRNIGGHQLSLTEAREICEKEITSNELEMYRDDGTIYRKRLGLSPDKLQIVKI